MQRIIGYECFLENTVRDLYEQLDVITGLLTFNCNFITDAIKNSPMGNHSLLFYRHIFFYLISNSMYAGVFLMPVWYKHFQYMIIRYLIWCICGSILCT